MTDISKLSENEKAVVLAKRAYFRNWRKNNKEKAKAYQQRYWEKKAQEQQNTKK